MEFNNIEVGEGVELYGYKNICPSLYFMAKIFDFAIWKELEMIFIFLQRIFHGIYFH